MWVIFDLRVLVENRLGTCCRGVRLERNERETGGERRGRRDFFSLFVASVLNQCLEHVHSLFTTAIALSALFNRIYLPGYQIIEGWQTLKECFQALYVCPNALHIFYVSIIMQRVCFTVYFLSLGRGDSTADEGTCWLWTKEWWRNGCQNLRYCSSVCVYSI